MSRRAVLISSATLGLSGCDNDIDSIAEELKARSFDEIEVLCGPTATRSGILTKLDQLIQETDSGDTVTIAYSGHGGRVPHPAWEARQGSHQDPFLQFIVPTDIEESTEADFRGILSLELSRIQERLTERTENVTTILDCCHSAWMSRDAQLIPKAVTLPFSPQSVATRLASLGVEAEGADSNPDAVRLVACQPDQSAFERDSPAGRRSGVFTDMLVGVLRSTRDGPVNWDAVLEMVARRVAAEVPQQRPDLEGPGTRLPFSMTSPEREGLRVVSDGTGTWIDSAELLGIVVDDVFGLADSAGAEFATATVDRIAGGRAFLRVEPDGLPVPEGARARIRQVSLPRLGVHVRSDVERSRELSQFLEASPFLQLTSNSELEVQRDKVGLALVETASSDLVVDGLENSDPGWRNLRSRAEDRARSDRLRSLASPTGAQRLEAPVRLRMTAYRDDQELEPTAGGWHLRVGDRIQVDASNMGPRPVWVWLFDIGIDDVVSLLTQHSGLRLEPVGQPGSRLTIFGRRGPLPLLWGNAAPDRPRLEVLLGIFAERQQDLSPLATRDLEQPTALQQLLASADTGTRNLAAEEPSAGASYRIERMTFELAPENRDV
jgi:hypothetical protein